MPRWNGFTRLFRGSKAPATSSSTSDRNREPEKTRKTNTSPATSTDTLPTYRAVEFPDRQRSTITSEDLDTKPLPPPLENPESLPPRFSAHEKRHETASKSSATDDAKSRFKIPASLAQTTRNWRDAQGRFIFLMATPGPPGQLGAMVWFTFSMTNMMKHGLNWGKICRSRPEYHVQPSRRRFSSEFITQWAHKTAADEKRHFTGPDFLRTWNFPNSRATGMPGPRVSIFGDSEKELMQIDLRGWLSEAEILQVVGFSGGFGEVNYRQKVYEWDHGDSSVYFNLFTPEEEAKEWWTS